MCQKIKIHIDPHRVTYNIMFLYKIKYFIIFTAVNNKIFNELIILEKYRICQNAVLFKLDLDKYFIYI
jgi:hypothetical protein